MSEAPESTARRRRASRSIPLGVGRSAAAAFRPRFRSGRGAPGPGGGSGRIRAARRAPRARPGAAARCSARRVSCARAARRARGQRSSAVFSFHDARWSGCERGVDGGAVGDERRRCAREQRDDRLGREPRRDEALVHAVAGGRVDQACGVADEKRAVGRDRRAGPAHREAVAAQVGEVVGREAVGARRARRGARASAALGLPPSHTDVDVVALCEHPAVAAGNVAELDDGAALVALAVDDAVRDVALVCDPLDEGRRDPERARGRPVRAVRGDDDVGEARGRFRRRVVSSRTSTPASRAASSRSASRRRRCVIRITGRARGARPRRRSGSGARPGRPPPRRPASGRPGTGRRLASSVPPPQGLSRGKRARSTSSDASPARARWIAVAEPAGPPPTTTASKRFITWRLQSRLTTGVCPSGQRERAVNPSAQPTEVRILPPPLSTVCPAGRACENPRHGRPRNRRPAGARGARRGARAQGLRLDRRASEVSEIRERATEIDVFFAAYPRRRRRVARRSRTQSGSRAARCRARISRGRARGCPRRRGARPGSTHARTRGGSPLGHPRQLERVRADADELELDADRAPGEVAELERRARLLGGDPRRTGSRRSRVGARPPRGALRREEPARHVPRACDPRGERACVDGARRSDVRLDSGAGAQPGGAGRVRPRAAARRSRRAVTRQARAAPARRS